MLKISDLMLILLATFIWGSGFVAIEIGLDHFPPLLFILLRFFIPAVPLVFFVSRAGIAWKWIIYIGLTVGVFFYVFWYVAMFLGMYAGLAALLLQTQFIFTTLMSIYFFKRIPTTLQFFAMGLSLIGLLTIAYDRLDGNTQFLAFIVIIGGAVSWAVMHILMQKAGKLKQMNLMVYVSLIPPIPLFLMSLMFEPPQWGAIVSMDTKALLTLLYTGILGTIVSFAIWGYLIQKRGATIIAPFSMFIPVFAIVLSSLILGETFNTVTISGSSLIFLGLLINGYNPFTRGVDFKNQPLPLYRGGSRPAQ